jgi:metallophosphoesterase (TIGR00282 family)
LEEIYKVLENKNTVRPFNIVEGLKEGEHGSGSIQFKFKNKTIRITNLLGLSVQVRDIQTNPFIAMEKVLLHDSSDIHIVDFHCETTSEKNAFLLLFAGRVSAILGTHTHIQTADERIFNRTAYITDAGMTGGQNGVIGAQADAILEVFQGKKERFKLSPSLTPYQLNGVVIKFDDTTSDPIKIERIFFRENN